MRSSLEESLHNLNDPNICSDAYAPSTPASLKVVSDSEIPFHFEVQKSYLGSDLMSKSTSSLKGQKVIVTLDTTCSSDNDTLSSKVLAQNSHVEILFERKAFPFVINDDMDLAQLEALADNDPCVLGLTRPGRIKTASLPVPALNDSGLSKQNHLSSLNFAHVYENLIQKQMATQKVRVGFVDTGVDCTHSDLQPNLVSNCGFNAIGTGSPLDNDGHGSHTAGLTGAALNNGIGVAGFTGNSIELHAIRVIDVSGGDEQAAYDGIQYAISKRLDVINISLESGQRLTLLENGVQEAVAAGIVVVMAAGNHSQQLGVGIQASPGMIGKSLPGAITVGSIDLKTGMLSTFSNFGNNVEIATAGAFDSLQVGQVGGLYSTNKGGSYQRLMGTSQAAPLVTSAASLAIQFFKQRSVPYSPALIESLLINSSDTVPSVNVASGRVLNFSKLVRNIHAYAGVPLCEGD